MTKDQAIASLNGWNGSARSCRETSIGFYYSWLGYKADNGDEEAVEYGKNHRKEIILYAQQLLEKEDNNRFVQRVIRPPKKQKTKKAIQKRRQTTIYNSPFDSEYSQASIIDKLRRLE